MKNIKSLGKRRSEKEEKKNRGPQGRLLAETRQDLSCHVA